MQDLNEIYIDFPTIRAETGVDRQTAHNWANYHNYFEKVYVLGKPVVLRTEFERFKREHPELIKANAVATQPTATELP